MYPSVVKSCFNILCHNRFLTSRGIYVVIHTYYIYIILKIIVLKDSSPKIIVYQPSFSKSHFISFFNTQEDTVF